MSGTYLTDLADVVRQLGLSVHEEPGWQSRARSSGGYSSGRPTHVMCHHTASGAGSDGQPDVDYMTYNSSDRPLANLYLSRAGEVWVMAAGATNTNGKGSSAAWGGGVPNDSMNSYAIGIEAGNNGVGEPWPDAQQQAYLVLVNGLCARYGINPAWVRGHAEWAPDRKIDPAGPSVFGTVNSSQTWNMDTFRTTALSGSAPPPSGGTVPPEPTPVPPEPTPTPPEPTPTPPPSEDWMATLPDIKFGDSGPAVKRMQHLLAAAGYMNEANTANYDGHWGGGTDDAKRRFDLDHGLLPSPPTDCGDKSWRALNGA